MSLLNPTIVQATSNTVTVVLNPQLSQVAVVKPQNGATVVRDSVIRGPVGPIGPQGIPGLNDWVVITSNYTANNRDRLIANTSNGSFTITLPDPPSLGDYIQITDGDDWSTNYLYIDPQSSTIEGFSGVMNVNVQGITIELINDNVTWQVTATLGTSGQTGPQGPQGPTGPTASAIPQISFTGDATLTLTDAGKHYYSILTTANTLTIPANSSVSFAVGSTVGFVNRGSANVTIANSAGVNLYLAGNSTNGSRNIISYGVATIQKVSADTWFVSGTGVS